MLANTFGSAMPLSMEMERRVMTRKLRLPYLPCDNHASDIMEDNHCKFGFDDYFQLSSQEPATSVEMQTQLEKDLDLKVKMHF